MDVRRRGTATERGDSAVTDGELVGRARRGDRSALADLFRRHVGSVRACVLAVLGPRDDVDDLVQESLVRGMAGLEKLRDPDRFGPWLRGITRHLCVDRIRRKPPPTATLDAVPEPAAPEAEIPDDHAELWRAIEALPESHRETLHLFYVAQLSYAEIGTQLGITAAAVNQRLTRARARLRDRLAATPSTGTRAGPNKNQRSESGAQKAQPNRPRPVDGKEENR